MFGGFFVFDFSFQRNLILEVAEHLCDLPGIFMLLNASKSKSQIESVRDFPGLPDDLGIMAF